MIAAFWILRDGCGLMKFAISQKVIVHVAESSINADWVLHS